MKCFTCTQLTGVYKTDKYTCASCREELKIDIVMQLLEMDPVYLSESNRNKKGRKPKLTADQENDLYQSFIRKDLTMEELEKKYDLKKSAIYNIVNKIRPVG